MYALTVTATHLLVAIGMTERKHLLIQPRSGYPATVSTLPDKLAALTSRGFAVDSSAEPALLVRTLGTAALPIQHFAAARHFAIKPTSRCSRATSRVRTKAGERGTPPSPRLSLIAVGQRRLIPSNSVQAGVAKRTPSRLITAISDTAIPDAVFIQGWGRRHHATSEYEKAAVCSKTSGNASR